jgi:hypothetical protein
MRFHQDFSFSELPNKIMPLIVPPSEALTTASRRDDNELMGHPISPGFGTEQRTWSVT